jgi:putative FmdB family regulatory protein
MRYRFKCEKCDEVKEIDMSISEYEEFESKCKECGSKLMRIYESPAVSGAHSGGDSNSADDDKESGGFSACAGSCASCAGCSV